MAGEERILSGYKEQTGKKILFGLLFCLMLVLVIVVSVVLGSYSLPISEIWSALFFKGSDVTSNIIWNIRIPRILTAIVAGAGLSVAGAAMQSILKNPLGSPFTLGISSAAGFGAAFSIGILGAGTMHASTANAAIIINNPYLTTFSAFFWSLVATMVILFLAKYKGASPETMILTGVALGSLFTAGTTAIQYFSDDVRIAAIVFWTFGDLGRASLKDLGVMALFIIPAIFYFLVNAWNYNAMKYGDETAKSLGVNVDAIRIAGMLISSFITAVAVSFVGIIGFVGLVVPHIVRKIIGGNEMYLIPFSCVLGALLLLLSDIAARTVIAPVVLPVGILTSFMGAPLFIYLVIKGREYW
ncbi:MAG: iron ABC transporter permease [Bacillota bacterium]